MHAKYVYSASATAANILADAIAILTGTTTPASLSASCNTATTTISAAYAVAGWSVYDASAGANAQVLRALNTDATTYRYLEINTNSAGYFLCKVWESWNSGTHAGTNLAYNSDATNHAQQLDVTNGGVLYIDASAHYAIFHSMKTTGNVWGDSSNHGGCGLIERTRLLPFDTTANNYPTAVFVSLSQMAASAGATSCWSPRVIDYGSNVLSGSGASFFDRTWSLTPFDTFTFYSGTTMKIPDGAGATYIPCAPIWLQLSPGTMPACYGDISTNSGLYVIPQSVAANLDTVLISSTTYIVYQESSTTMLMILPMG